MTGDEASARDVVQEVFLKLWEKRSDIRVRSSVKAMLYTMVRNRSLNMIRDRQHEATDVAPGEAATAIYNASARTDPSIGDYLMQWIYELPERRREAFMLSRFHDLTHAEISRIMGVSERTVNTHILLALRSIRERYDRFQEEENR